MKSISHFKTYVLGIFIISIFCTTIQAQVGIGTITPNSDALLDLSNDPDPTEPQFGMLLPRVALTVGPGSPAPLTAHVEGMTIYNTATIGGATPGIYINDGGQWERVEDQSPVSSTVQMTGDNQISSATYAAVPGMPDLVFTARQSNVLIMLTTSGFGYTNSMAFVQLRVENVTTSTIIGGTQSAIQSYDNVTGTITTWSAAFSKLITGLTVGTTYTLSVQGQVAGILGVPNAALFTSTYPTQQHMTLSVVQ